MHILISFMAECSINVFQTWLWGHSLKFQARFWHNYYYKVWDISDCVERAAKQNVLHERDDPNEEGWHLARDARKSGRTIHSKSVGETGITCTRRLGYRVFSVFRLCVHGYIDVRFSFLTFVWWISIIGFSAISACPPSFTVNRTPCMRVQLRTGVRECGRVSRTAAAVLPSIQWQARSRSLCLQQNRMRSAPLSDAAKSQLVLFCLCFVSLSTQYFSLITLARLMWKVE